MQHNSVKRINKRAIVVADEEEIKPKTPRGVIETNRKLE